jgi:cation diffusion facilitator CzcD-associated flavoprotein CzcO
MSDATREPEVCIIGAGCSGLVSAKALLQRGVRCEVFEKGSQLGGMWRYENDNGQSCAYRSLHIDTSKKSLAYPDFPVPEDWPDFLSHEQVVTYLERYADHFGLAPHIHYRHTVQQVLPLPDGQWLVSVANAYGVQQRRYRAVLVANGHLWSPRMAQFQGAFNGTQMHSLHYRTPTPFEGQRVLVVGFGNSAVDIAVDLCRQAKSVVLSTRRGAYVMPKYIMGVPTDRWSAFLSRTLRLPTRTTRTLMGQLVKLAVGDQRRQGVPRPGTAIWREHACVSQDLLPYVGHGWVRIKPDIRELAGDEVVFTDGSREAFDTIIHATGYKTEFPFLAPEVFQVQDKDARLYRRMVAVDRPGLYFMGLVQPIGPTVPLVEVQARWVAAVLCGAVRLPGRAAMQAEIDQHLRKLKARYVDSARYTLEVDFREHVRELRADMAA